MLKELVSEMVLFKNKKFASVEQHLIKNLPKNKISLAHHWLILHGRYVCKARNPQCINCGITKVCDFYRKNVKTN
jgi:endonuclease-3